MISFRAGRLLLALCSTIGISLMAEEAPRPNIVFLLADDLGFGDLSVQGSKTIRTPNLDRLAAGGIRFAQFYANAPICSPSRVSFVTGQYPQRWKITSAITYRDENKKWGVADCLPTEAPSLARLLHDAGYATGHFGKWHLGGGRDVGEAPCVAEYGFDEVLTQFEGLGDRLLPVFGRPMRPHWGEESRHPLGVESARLGQGTVEFVPRAEMTGRWVDHAIEFIKKSKTNGTPFYVNVWPDDPHTPLEPSPAHRGDGSNGAIYRGVVEELDRDLGKLIDFVQADPELRANTVIIFASDNGPEKNVGSSGGYRGAKTTLYEGGIRVPLIVWAPRFIPKDATGSLDTRSLVMGIDVAPTILAIAEVSARSAIFDGKNMKAAWFGKPMPAPRTVFWSRPPDQPGQNGELPDVAIRGGDWKLLLHDRSQAVELYDLASDPTEAKNRADQEPGVVKTLLAALAVWRAEVGQTFPPK